MVSATEQSKSRTQMSCDCKRPWGMEQQVDDGCAQYASTHCAPLRRLPRGLRVRPPAANGRCLRRPGGTSRALRQRAFPTCLQSGRLRPSPRRRRQKSVSTRRSSAWSFAFRSETVERALRVSMRVRASCCRRRHHHRRHIAVTIAVTIANAPMRASRALERAPPACFGHPRRTARAHSGRHALG